MRKRIFSILLCLAMLLAFLPVTALAATTINTVNVTVAYPEAGKKPADTATVNGSGYKVYDIEWYDETNREYLESGDLIRADVQYTATVWLEAKDGYAFNAKDDLTPNVTAIVNGEAVTATKAYEYKAWAMVCVTYYFSAVPSKGWVDRIDLTVVAPIAGQKPDYTQLSGTTFKSGDVSFSGNSNENMKNGIAWKTTDGKYITPGVDAFAENTKYVLYCILLPREGYRFRPDARVYVNGFSAEAYYDYDAFLSVKCELPATGKVESSHTHFYTDWQYNFGQHYKNCTDCDEIFFLEAHKGGVATCEEPGKCTVCGYAYIEPSEDYHVPDTSKWIARGEMYHFHKCSICGAHCDIEDHKWSPKYHPVDAGGHAYQCADCKGYDVVIPHKAGPEATDTDPQVCLDCGYIIAPAKNHTHSLTLVPEVAPTCVEPGTNAYYACSGCSELFKDENARETYTADELVIPPQGHKISNGWEFDEKTHWRVCAECGEKIIETDMEHELKDGKCTTCEYDKNKSEETEPQETEPKETKPHSSQKTSDDEPKGLQWWVIVLIGVGAVALGIGTGVVLMIVKKKR